MHIINWPLYTGVVRYAVIVVMEQGRSKQARLWAFGMDRMVTGLDGGIRP